MLHTGVDDDDDDVDDDAFEQLSKLPYTETRSDPSFNPLLVEAFLTSFQTSECDLVHAKFLMILAFPSLDVTPPFQRKKISIRMRSRLQHQDWEKRVLPY
ncbi:hypothetical protein VNO77_02146 [Canavalia gladiata]|uniref:Uncharacterized protein n=1 Tax=Canavalia gladiata TaxID=3824 RepID=A0AAN9MSI1_CANGL